MKTSNDAVPHMLRGDRLRAFADGARTPAVLTLPASAPEGHRLASASSYDATARTVELTAATETAVLMPGYLVGLYDCEHYYEILDCSASAVDLSQVAAGNVPVLDTHNRWGLGNRLGVIRSGRSEANEIVTLCAFGQSPEARAAEAEFAGGTPPKVSAGYRRNQMILAGIHEDIPIYRVSSWTLTEVSLVSIAADPNAGVRSAHPVQTPVLTLENTMTLPTIGAAIASTLASLPLPIAEGARSFPEIIGTRGPAPQQPAPQPIAPAPAPVPAPAPAPASAPVAAPVVEPVAPAPNSTEGARGATPSTDRFTASATLAMLEVARPFGDGIVTRAQELIAQNERGEIGTDAARTALVQAAADGQRAAAGGLANGGRAIQVTADESDKFRNGARNSILQRAGLIQLVSDGARALGQTPPDLDPGEFRGIHNAELARMSLERAGQRVSSYDRDLVVGEAMGIRTGPMQATTDFPAIFDSVINIVVQAAYATTPDTWSEFCATGSVTDFRPTSNLLVGTLGGGLDPILEDGEVKNKALPDGAKEAIQAKPHGNIVALTREMIVNDNLGVFSDTAVELGRLGKRSIELDVYRLLAMNGGFGPLMRDGKTLFHADHGNLVNPGGPISIDQIEAMDNVFAAQTDLTGAEVLDINLALQLVPYALGGRARIINESDSHLDPTGKVLIPNQAKGKFEKIIASKRLRGTTRYGFANPTEAPTLKVVFLNGNQEPKVESKDGWRISGTEWRVLFDYGVGAINYRGAVMDPGQ